MPGSLASRRALGLLLGCLVAAGFAPTRAAHADFTSGGAPIANTSASLTGNLVGPVGCQAGPGPTCDTISLPGTSGAQAPEDDLADALTRLASTADPAVAADAVTEARAILAGDPLPGRAYSGMGLLNWAPFAKVATVPAAGTVTVNVVRTPQHTLSDTWLLNFEDPSQPYTIRYRVSEAGSAPIGQ